MKRLCILICCALMTGCALRGTAEIGGVRTADALSEFYPADAERFATQAALELSKRYPAGQTGLCIVTVPGLFGVTLETHLRNHGFAILPPQSGAGVKVGYMLDEITGELAPTGYLQVNTSDGTQFSVIRKLIGGLPAAPVSSPENSVPGTPVVLPQDNTPVPPKVQQTALHEHTPPPVSLPTARQTAAPAATHTVPIITAVRTLIPVGWQYRVEGTELRQKHVSYPRNVAWQQAMTDLARTTDAQLSINEQAKLVTVTQKGLPFSTPISSGGTSSEPASSPVVTPSESSPVVAQALHDAARESHAGTTLLPETAPASPTSPKVEDVPKLEAKPVPRQTPGVTLVAEPMLPSWEIGLGSLHVQLEGWTKKAGFQLIWNAETDLDMQSVATFRGNFVGAITQLFEGLHAAGFPLTATIYQANNVLEVGDR